MTVHTLPAAKQPAGYRMQARGSRGEIFLYGIIGVDPMFWGEGVTATQFAKDLKALGKVDTIDLRINSDGGIVTDARAIYSLLNEHPAKIVTHIDGIAASAASIVAMVGAEILIAEGGFVMIHNARMGVWGEAADLERGATVLRTVNETVIETYAARTGNSAKKIADWMDAETWFTGTEAVKNGFADRVVENMKVAACLTQGERFKNLPAALRPNRLRAAAAIAAMAG